MNLSNRLFNYIFYISLFLIYATRTLRRTTMRWATDAELFLKLSAELEYIAVGGLLVKVLRDFYYGTKEDRIKIALLLGIAVPLYIKSKLYIVPVLIILAACKHIELKKCAKLLFFLQLVIMCSVGLMSQLGFIEDIHVSQPFRGIESRHGYGMQHPNTFGGMAVQLVSLAIFAWADKYQLPVMLFNAAVMGITFWGANSRTATACLMVELCGTAYIYVRPSLRSIKAKLDMYILDYGRYTYLGVLLLSFLAMLGLLQCDFLGSEFAARFSTAGDYFYYYPFTLFGQTLSTRGIPNFYCDNGYTALLVRSGIIGFSFSVVVIISAISISRGIKILSVP